MLRFPKARVKYIKIIVIVSAGHSLNDYNEYN